MSLATALSSAVGGLSVKQRGLEVASHNIANANTDGYSRRVVNQETVVTARIAGGGVRIANIERVTNDFLSSQVRTEVASLGKAQVRDQYFTQMQDFFGSISTNSSIGQRLADMSAQMEALAVEPESPTSANALLDAAQTFAREMNTLSEEILTLRHTADAEIAAAVSQLNEDLATVEKLNEDIQSLINADRDTGDLRDQRDNALKRIGEMINIRTFERATGEIAIFTGDSRMLMDGSAETLVYESSTASDLNVVYEEIALADGTSIQADFRDGRIKGLLEMRDKVLPNLHLQLDALAANTRDVANAAHNRGAGLPGADQLTGTRNFTDTATETVVTSDDVRFVIHDRNGLTVAAFDLPAGAYTIDDLATAVDTGLQPSGSATLVNNRLILEAADSNHAIGVVDLNGGADATITYDDGSGPVDHAGFSNFFGLNDLFITPGRIVDDASDGVSGLIEVRSDIVSNPERLSRGRITTAAAAPTPGADHAIAIGDGSVMQEMAAAFASSRAIDAVGGLPPINKPLHEYAAEIVGLNSQLAADGAEKLAFEEALVEQFQTRLQDVSGVNVDEELANILVLQNAFAASARVITTADEMMDLITQMVR